MCPIGGNPNHLDLSKVAEWVPSVEWRKKEIIAAKGFLSSKTTRPHVKHYLRETFQIVLQTIFHSLQLTSAELNDLSSMILFKRNGFWSYSTITHYFGFFLSAINNCFSSYKTLVVKQTCPELRNATFFTKKIQ